MRERQEFTKKTKLEAWQRCGGICECGCRQKIIGAVEYDHRQEDYIGGDNSLENCVVLRKKCHDEKTQERRPEIDKTRRILEKRAGVRKKSSFRKPNGMKYNWGTGRYERE